MKNISEKWFWNDPISQKLENIIIFFYYIINSHINI